MKKAEFSPEAAIAGSKFYPEPHNEKLEGRRSWPLNKQFGLLQFGINRVELAPGTWSTQRHWHKTNDEAVVMISGELVVVTDDGEEVIRAGDCIAFRAGDENAHHLQNRSDAVAVYYDIGGRDPWDVATFPDMGYEARTKMLLDFRPLKKK